LLRGAIAHRGVADALVRLVGVAGRGCRSYGSAAHKFGSEES
jgi:hypothetical protein